MKRITGLIICTLIALAAILAIGPLDLFSHGFFCDEIDVSQIAEMDILGEVKPGDEKSSVVFSPQKKHFTGFELYLVNQIPENRGTLNLIITDSSGNTAGQSEVQLNQVKDSTWYKIYSNASLKTGEQYTLSFNIEGNDQSPSFIMVDSGYLPDETIDGNILIAYAYRQSTFSFPEKVLISMFIIAAWGICVWALMLKGKGKPVIRSLSLGLLLTTLLASNYMYSSMDNQNLDAHYWMHYDSEPLVTGTAYAYQDGISFYEPAGLGYGLGVYWNMRGIFKSYDNTYITDENWLEGYNRTLPMIIVARNLSTYNNAVPGNYIKFKNGEEYQITDIIKNDDYYVLELNADRALSQARNGSLDDAVFFDADHNELPKTAISAYNAQYGLQGKVFRHIAKNIDRKDIIPDLNLLCSVLTGLTFVVLVWLLSKKYNYLLAGCFYITFWLSPWIVNFGRNMYWVEFTWFIPMIIGLLCAWKIDSLKCRLICYAGAFAAIALRSLCGYEYISVIMMGLIAFPVIDFVKALAQKNRKRAMLLLRAVIILGIAALAGFILAICLHANLKGNGDLTVGIRRIIQEDLLRRTNGANLNNYDSALWPSMNASIWETLGLYFSFSTQIITGIDGNLFPVLCVIPIGIFAVECVRKKPDYEGMAAYAFFFLAAISWFCLAKSHSYIHTFLNFVLWYFGFVQTCFYVIVSRVAGTVKKLAHVKKN